MARHSDGRLNTLIKVDYISTVVFEHHEKLQQILSWQMLDLMATASQYKPLLHSSDHASMHQVYVTKQAQHRPPVFLG